MGDSQTPRPEEERRILVVDDDELMRDLLTDLLQDSGYSVIAVESGKDALAAMRETEFGVAIVDKNMPGISGLDVIEQARDINPLMPIILFTAFPSQESAIEALRSGAFDYVQKPADNKLLIEKVNRGWSQYVLQVERQELFRKYEALFELVPGIVWFMTEDGVVKRINEEGAHMLGYGPTDVLEQPYTMLLPEDDPEGISFWALGERRTGHRATRRQTVALKTRAGLKRLFEVNSTGAYDRSSAQPHKRFWGTLGVGWDITERTHLEAQLSEARRVEAIGRVAGAVAHDFNNLLSVILAGGDILSEIKGLPEDAVLEIQEIRRAARAAAQLTDQLLAISRRKVVKRTPLFLPDKIRGLEHLLTRTVTETVQVKLLLDDSAGLVKMDEGQLQQILINLAANARDAMMDGGTLTIEVSEVVLDEDTAARYIGARPGAYVQISVQDTGVGMSEEVRDRLFEAFFTTKEPGQGTGLGMATVHGIVSQCEGFLRVESKSGEGSTVLVYFPVTDEAPQEKKDKPISHAPRGSETVLVVEDEPMMRRMTCRVLKRNGYTALEAEDGTAGFEVFKEHRGTIGLLLTDLMMPGMSGTELARRARELNPKLPVVFMSGYIGEGIQPDELVESGAVFLQKPFSGPTLLDQVRALLDD